MSNPSKRARLRLKLRGLLALASVASMVGAVGATTPGPTDAVSARQTLERRVLAIRAVLTDAHEPKSLGQPFGTLAQWFNWNNWGNWGNWNNWGNWPNWANWPNWFNR